MGWAIRRADGTYRSWQASDVKPDWALADGEVLEQQAIAVVSGPAAADQYKALRRDAYPPIGDQLDMLWHAMDGGFIVRHEPFYSTLAAVKAKYPKPKG